MAIINQTVIEGPDIQASGAYRGTVEFEFDDGRKVTRRYNAADAQAWSEYLVDASQQVEQDQAEIDAKEFAEVDQEIMAYKQANIKQVALRYLRRAYEIGDPYIAYLRFSRFNDYRLAQGWNLNQVVAGLTEVGLTDEEWTDLRDRYQYLSQSARVTAMEAYQGVLAGDTWGAEFR